MQLDHIFHAKLTMVKAAIADLPPNLNLLLVSQLTYETVGAILNELTPRLFHVDLRILWAAFDMEGCQQGLALAQSFWANEVGNDARVGTSNAAAMFLAFCMANVQYTAIGGKSIAEAGTLPMQQVGWAVKGATQNANVMYQKIFGGSLGGTKPSGCLILLPLMAGVGLCGAIGGQLIARHLATFSGQAS
jgi:hypothetical protein